MGPESIFDTTSGLLQANLDRRTTQHRLISRNIANLDTPNYTGTGLEFEKQLRSALEGGVLPTSASRTHQMHMPSAELGTFGNAPGEYMDTGPVFIDIEMSKLAENNIMFQAMVKLLNKKFSLLKSAIADSGGR